MQPRGCRNLFFTIFSFVLYYPLALAQGPKNKTYYDTSRFYTEIGIELVESDKIAV